MGLKFLQNFRRKWCHVIQEHELVLLFQTTWVIDTCCPLPTENINCRSQVGPAVVDFARHPCGVPNISSLLYHYEMKLRPVGSVPSAIHVFKVRGWS